MVSSGCYLCRVLHVLMFMWDSSGFSSFFQSHLCKCASVYVCESGPVMDWCSMQGVFPPYTQCSRDRLRIQLMYLLENEWMNEFCKLYVILVLIPNSSPQDSPTTFAKAALCGKCWRESQPCHPLHCMWALHLQQFLFLYFLNNSKFRSIIRALELFLAAFITSGLFSPL